MNIRQNIVHIISKQLGIWDILVFLDVFLALACPFRVSKSGSAPKFLGHFQSSGATTLQSSESDNEKKVYKTILTVCKYHLEILYWRGPTATVEVLSAFISSLSTSVRCRRVVLNIPFRLLVLHGTPNCSQLNITIFTL